MKKETKEILDKIVSFLAMYDPDQIIVFGSVARGTETPASDLDICFVCKEIPHEGVDELSVHLSEEMPSGSKAIDLLVITRYDINLHKNNRYTVYSKILKEGLSVYRHDIGTIPYSK